MDYQRHYDRLMERARGRVLVGYSERHHALPKCLGGGNGDNIVRLTPEEHYVAHQLLVKMYPGHMGLLWAAVAMTNGTRRMARRNKLFGWLRRRLAGRLSKRFKGSKASDEARANMSAAHQGKKRQPHTAETKAKMSAASKGRRKTAAHRQSMSAARKGKLTGPHSPAWIANQKAGLQRAAAQGKFSYERSDEYRAKQADRMREVWAKRASGELPMPVHE
jgi:hypothetical protein